MMAIDNGSVLDMICFLQVRTVGLRLVPGSSRAVAMITASKLIWVSTSWFLMRMVWRTTTPGFHSRRSCSGA
ncbi:hypothetical protein [Mycobacterium sp. URHB0021]